MDIADRSAKKKATTEWGTEWITTAGVITLAATAQIEAVGKIATSLLGGLSFAIQPILLLIALVWFGAAISAKTNTEAKESAVSIIMPTASGHGSKAVYTYSQLLRNIAKLAFFVMVIALPLKMLEAANEVMPLGNVLYGYLLDLEEKPIDGVRIRVVSRSGRDITSGEWQSDSRGFYVVRATHSINRSDVLNLAVPTCQSQFTVSLGRNNDLPATYRLEAGLHDLSPFFLHHLSCEKK